MASSFNLTDAQVFPNPVIYYNKHFKLHYCVILLGRTNKDIFYRVTRQSKTKI